MKHIYTDLAVETKEMYQPEKEEEISGVAVDVEEEQNHSVTTVEILDEKGSQTMGKPIGKYLTIEVPNLENADEDLKDEMSIVVAKELKKLTEKYKKDKILIIGLGNWNISSDALGPKVVDKVLVTRQFFINYNKEFDESMSNIAAMSPGVMGITGIETSDIVKGI